MMDRFLSRRFAAVVGVGMISALIGSLIVVPSGTTTEAALAAKEQAPNDGGHVNVLIVGAGAAGLQWGTLLSRQDKLSYAILEQNDRAGAFWEHFPRGRKLISVNKRHVGKDKSDEFSLRHDWNSLLHEPFGMRSFSKEYYPQADDLARYFRNVSAQLEPHVHFRQKVISTSWNGSIHVVMTSSGIKWTCDHLIVSTGYAVKKYPSCFDEISDDVTVYDYGNFPPVTTGDEEWCRNKRVLVLGNGNSAFEASNIISNCGSAVFLAYASKPQFSPITHYVGSVRFRNADIFDRYQLKSLDVAFGIENMLQMLPPELRELNNASRISEASMCAAVTEVVKISGAEVIVFAGGFTTEMDGLVKVSHDETAPAAARKFPAVDAFWQDPSVPQKWYAGCSMHSLDFKRSAGGFIHGFRYLVRAQYNYIMSAFYDRPWPVRRFSALEDRGFGDVDVGTLWQNGAKMTERVRLIDHIVSRIQNSSALYQMQEVLFDVVDLTGAVKGDGPVYVEEVPEPWMRYAMGGTCRRCVLVGLKYSNKHRWTFDMLFDETRTQQHPGLFLHPVFYAVRNGKKIAEAHVSEDVDFEFVDPRFLKPMRRKLMWLIDMLLGHTYAYVPGEYESLDSAASTAVVYDGSFSKKMRSALGRAEGAFDSG